MKTARSAPTVCTTRTRTGRSSKEIVTGTLMVTEEKSIDGYTIDADTRVQTVVVNPRSDTQSLYFYNAPSVGWSW